MARMLRGDGDAVNRKRGRRLMRRWASRFGTEAAHEHAGGGTQDIPLPAAWPADRPAEPGMGAGHHLPAHRPRPPSLLAHGLGERAVLSWRLSNIMDVSFCIVLQEALARFGKPEIFNADQGKRHPMFRTWMILLKICWLFRGFGPGRFIGIRGSIFVHCSSFDQNGFALIAPRFVRPTH
jgi:hypothetical protein